MVGLRTNILIVSFNVGLMALYWIVFSVPEVGYLRAISVSYMIYVGPGLWVAFLLWRRTRDPFVVLLAVIVASTSYGILSTGLYVVLERPPTAAGVWLGALLASLFGSGAALYLDRGRTDSQVPTSREGKGRIGWLVLLFSATLFSATYWAAVKSVPPLEDFDFEAQATAVGLMRTGKPYMLTDRNTYMFFAHPILMNLWTAQSFLYFRTLPQLESYYQFALSGQEALKSRIQVGEEISARGSDHQMITVQVVDVRGDQVYVDQDIPGQGRVLNMLQLRSDVMRQLVRAEYEHFHANPRLLETRLPNIFFTVGTPLVLLFLLLKETRNSWTWALLGAATYASFPEIFFRGGFGALAFTSVTNFCFALLLYFYWQLGKTPQGIATRRWALFVTGIFLAWVNHKGFFVPVALLTVELFQGWWRSRSFAWTRSRLWEGGFWGFTVGTILFWLYGFWCAPDQFLQEHFYYHLVNRLTHHETLGYSGYPGVVQLWAELFRSLGIPFLLLAVPLCLYQLKDLGGRRLILPVWFLLGAVIYSAVDWRQTKHLMLIVIPLVVSVVLFASRLSRKWQIGLGGILGWVILRNLWIIHEVSQDWSYLQLTPAW